MLVSELSILLSTMPQTHEVMMLVAGRYSIVDEVVISEGNSVVVLQEKYAVMRLGLKNTKVKDKVKGEKIA